VLKTTGQFLLNELAAKAFFQWLLRRGEPRRFRFHANSTRTVFRAIFINELSFGPGQHELFDESGEEVG